MEKTIVVFNGKKEITRSIMKEENKYTHLGKDYLEYHLANGYMISVVKKSRKKE